jgi:hypothetical protein
MSPTNPMKNKVAAQDSTWIVNWWLVLSVIHFFRSLW